MSDDPMNEAKHLATLNDEIRRLRDRLDEHMEAAQVARYEHEFDLCASHFADANRDANLLHRTIKQRDALQ